MSLKTFVVYGKFDILWNLGSDRATGNRTTNKLENKKQFSKTVGIRFQKCCKCESSESRIMRGITINDNIADRENLTVVSLDAF